MVNRKGLLGRRRLVVFLVVAVLSAGLVWGMSAALGASTSPSPAGGKVIMHVGWTNDPDSLNPLVGYESSSYEVFALTYDLLVGFKTSDYSHPQGAQATGLATSWSNSSDGKVWTFKLRSGVKCSDGQPLTAKDVAFTYNYIIQNQVANYTPYTQFINHVEAPDDTTVVIYCDKPKANMLNLWIPILPEHIWKSVSGKAFTNFQMPKTIYGSGPFYTVERQVGKFVKMEVNPYYWRGKPTVDEIVFENYQNQDTMGQDLKSGALQAAWNIPEATFHQMDTPPVHTITYPTIGFDELAFNCYTGPSLGNPVCQDPAFRSALNWAVDRNVIVNNAYLGFAAPGDTACTAGYYPKGSIDWHWEPPADVKYGFDLTKCGQLLDAAGYPLKNGVRVDKNGKPITLRLFTRTESTSSLTAGKLITGWFEKVGLNIKLQPLDDGTITNKIVNTVNGKFTPDYDMFIWGWGGDYDPMFILSIFTSAQVYNGWSDSAYRNPTYDKLFAEQNTTIDQTKRKAIVDQMQQILYKDSPYIILAYPYDVEGYNDGNWTGWVRNLDGKGGVIYTTFIDSYLYAHPGSAAKSSSSSSSSVWIVIGVVAGLIVVAVIVLLAMRGRRRQVEEG
jgi:peptide/nickel transport system substrate-binding protein